MAAERDRVSGTVGRTRSLHRLVVARHRSLAEPTPPAGKAHHMKRVYGVVAGAVLVAVTPLVFVAALLSPRLKRWMFERFKEG